MKRRLLRWIVFPLLGILAIVFVALQVVLDSAFLAKAVNSIADEYVDGTVAFSRVRASMFRSFPNLNVSIDDFSLTYPHDRFAAYDSLVSPGDSLHNLGRSYPVPELVEGPGQDTLAHFDRLSVSVNYLEAFRKRIRVRHAILEHPRIFAHRYDSVTANWNIFKTGPSSDKDPSSFKVPDIKVGKLSLGKEAFAVFTSIPDSLEAALSLDHLTLKNHRDHYDIDLLSRILIIAEPTGRMVLPLQLKTRFIPDFERNVYELQGLRASVATVDMTGSARVDMSGEHMYIKAGARIDREPVSEVVDYFGDNFPILKKLHTDALISLDADCDGYYIPETKSLPELSVHLEVPDSHIGWEGIGEKGRFDLDATATVVDGRLTAQVQDFCFHIQGADINLSGSAADLLCDDPLLNIDSNLHLRLDSLMHFLPEGMDLTARGSLDGNVKGAFRLSQLDIYNFAGIGLTGELRSGGIRIESPSDSLLAFLGSTTISLGPYTHDEDGDEVHGEEEHHHVGLSGTVDSLYAEYGASTFIRGTGIKLAAHNSDESIKGSPGKHPLHGHLDIASIGMMDLDSCFVGVKGSGNVFKLTPTPAGRQTIPYMSLSSSNKAVTIRERVNRYSAEGVSLSIAAHPNSVEAGTRRKHLLDSLQRVYPGVARDSLFRRAFSRLRGGQLPDYLSEKDFEKKDIHISLGESAAKYLKEWDLSGSFSIRSGAVITPYYPLDNNLSGLRGRFSNNRIDLSNATVKSGASDISASGYLTGFKRLLTSGKGRLTLDMDISSEYIDVNEILLALNAGKQYVPPEGNLALAGVDDGTYLNSVRAEAVADTSATASLIVLPANLNARVGIQAGTVRYSNLETSYVSTDIEMKERCLQATNTLAMTNMGEVFLEGFYSTRTKKDLKAGFDLMLSNITAEKVIQLFPAVDSIMPMLKAFKGLLDCEMAATASIDTAMNIILPSLSGMIKIDGKNLSLSESKDLDKLRRTLRFKDRDSSYIDAMSVRGIVKENQLEIFPFILKVDRYTLALNGIQQFDQKFKYHVAALKSPIPFRFGVNLGGTFADWKWWLGKAKFKSSKIPLFDTEVDDLRLNLVNSIHNIYSRGVEQAILQNEKAQEAIEEKKSEVSYSADQTEELSAEERKTLETLEKSTEVPEEVPAGQGSGN